MKITVDWLDGRIACSDGVEWFEGQSATDAVEVLNALIKSKKLVWAYWLIVRVIDRKQYLQYAVFAAEQVLPIFEKKYPKQDKVKKAIEAARQVILDDTAKNREAARAAADAAASVAADAAGA